MRGRYQGPDVLHLHASLALENEGGARARVLVSWDCWFRPRVVFGGAGEDFDRGGRGEQIRPQGEAGEVGAVVLV